MNEGSGDGYYKKTETIKCITLAFLLTITNSVGAQVYNVLHPLKHESLPELGAAKHRISADKNWKGGELHMRFGEAESEVVLGRRGIRYETNLSPDMRLQAGLVRQPGEKPIFGVFFKKRF